MLLETIRRSMELSIPQRGQVFIPPPIFQDTPSADPQQWSLLCAYHLLVGPITNAPCTYKIAEIIFDTLGFP